MRAKGKVTCKPSLINAPSAPEGRGADGVDAMA
jgi:hypothetical protein